MLLTGAHQAPGAGGDEGAVPRAAGRGVAASRQTDGARAAGDVTEQRAAQTHPRGLRHEVSVPFRVL